MRKPVQAGLVGLGWWGKKLYETVSQLSDKLAIVSASDPAPDAQKYALSKGLPLASLDEMLADDALEAILLVTPHALHAEQIERVAAAGKHLFCEKPLALTREGAQRAVSLCASAGLVLGIGHERRFEPPLMDAIRAAESGELGRLLQIEANFSHDKFMSLDPSNWRLSATDAPAAGMTATGIHLTDLATKFMGPALDVRASCENLVSGIPQGDTLSAHIRFRAGGTAYISASLGMPFISRFAVYGSRGWIDIRDKAHLENPQGWIVTQARSGSAIETAEVGPSEAVIANIDAFAAAVRGEQPYPITGREMIDNAALLEAIVAAASSSRTVEVNVTTA